MRKILSLILSLGLIGCGAENEGSELAIVGGKIASSDTSTKGLFPFAIGFRSFNGNSCTASRIGQNLYLTAGHCFTQSKLKTGSEIEIVLSNSLKISNLKISKFAVHQSYSSTASIVLPDSDIALFSIDFRSEEQFRILSQFSEVGKIETGEVSANQPVTLLGFGCEEINSLKTCVRDSNMKYLKYAASKVEGTNFPGVASNVRNFSLNGALGTGVDGYIGPGDSGGPVLNSNGHIIGTNVSLFGIGGIALKSIHAWLGYSDVKSFISTALADPGPTYMDTPLPTYTFANQNVYSGSWSKGLPSGQGTMMYADGKNYTGAFLLGVRVGFGHQTWNPGAAAISYEGSWSGDRPNGQGKMVYSNGQTITGIFVDGKGHGPATITYPDGDVRTGILVSNKREGEFVLTKPDGVRHLQIFQNDQLVSSTKI